MEPSPQTTPPQLPDKNALVQEFRAILHERCDAELLFHGILQFPLVSDDERRTILDALRSHKLGEASSLHRYGVQIDNLQYDFKPIVERYTRLANYFFLQPLDRRLRLTSGFGIYYAHGLDSKLREHQDDSDISINICLDGEFTGSQVVYIGCQSNRTARHKLDHGRHVATTLAPGIGQVFRGCHTHFTTEIESGERWNVVLWCKYEN